MDPITIIAFFVVMGLSVVAGKKFGGVSKVHRVEATVVTEGERCCHFWVQVSDERGKYWLRMTEGEYDNARRRAENNIQDAPK